MNRFSFTKKIFQKKKKNSFKKMFAKIYKFYEMV